MKFFVTTAIDYPSAKPHLGHALEKIQADVIARYKRKKGFKVHFSTGTDEHGLKILKQAQKNNQTPEQFVNKMVNHFKQLSQVLNISFDDFIRTTEPRHIQTVEKVLDKIIKNKDVYKGVYQGYYCVECETYYSKSELVNNLCPVHRLPVEYKQEESYFFKMSKYQDFLIKHIKDNSDFIIPHYRANEILERLKTPLRDLSISRDISWGIPFPGDEKYVIAVWVDALINYLSTINYPEQKFSEFWPADVHLIGKDILWHHSIIWGSLLKSAGLQLPKTLLVHGFITVEGKKMSKSLGNIIDPIEVAEKYGADTLRYYLLREFPPFEDGDFSYTKLERRYNSDLADGLGNLVARIEGIGSKFKYVKLKQAGYSSEEVKKIEKKFEQKMNQYKFNESLAAIWELISYGDLYINQRKLWRIEDPTEVSELIFILKRISDLLSPFMPETAANIFKNIKPISPGKYLIKKGKPMFPKIK